LRLLQGDRRLERGSHVRGTVRRRLWRRRKEIVLELGVSASHPEVDAGTASLDDGTSGETPRLHDPRVAVTRAHGRAGMGVPAALSLLALRGPARGTHFLVERALRPQVPG